MRILNIMRRKRTRTKNESRIRYLERMLKTAAIVKDDSGSDEVGINNVVEIYYEDEDETETYKLVTSIRGNSLDNKISIESPLGKAVRGHREGDRVMVRVNDTVSYPVVIKSIVKSTEDEDDQIRSF